MSRTRRNYAYWEDWEDGGKFLERGHCSIPKKLYERGHTEVWHPKAKKFRKRNISRKRRRDQNWKKEFDG